MDDFFSRQAFVLRQAINEYRDGTLDLNSLIHRIEGVGSVFENELWRNAVFPVILSMEQINAAAINGGNDLTEADKASIEESLIGFEGLIKDFENK
ncbi:hypothetical protein [Acidovorax sp. SUPP2539]|uniref:hypothetical protein n=1 Tax=Acidovorax sp. SUPP2539 TaxID=2920878 RepID=UPI0023DE42E4|nr:hypothetical protein [Acidovorax sp. SUPP2539]GKS91796.1 hypothetical protein AVTE2539_20545 [Acidovorax sp. SUPP2539]